MRFRSIKNIFKCFGYFCVWVSTLFIAFNLLISAALPSKPTQLNNSTLTQQSKKKVLYVTKYVENRTIKGQEVTGHIDISHSFSQAIFSDQHTSGVALTKYVTFYSSKDLPIQLCCLLI